MKHTFTGMMIAMILTLALMVGTAAVAENIAPTEPAPGQAQPEETQDADSAALQDAFKAYDEARSASRQEDLEAELKDFVESGKLTQEQADLILNTMKERQALRNGTCPNCGYQFQSGQGRGGRGNGGRGGKGGRMNGDKGGRGSGAMGGGRMGRQSAQTPNGGAAEDMAFQFDAQMLPEMDVSDDTL